MNVDLARLLEELRADLAEDRPASLAYAQFGDPGSEDDVPADLPAGLREFLLVVDGLRAGSFELASTRRLKDIQYYLDYAPDFSPITRNTAGWLVIGTRGDEPIFMARDTGAIWYFPAPGAAWFTADTFAEIAPALGSFVHYYLLGPGYPELVAADDRWQAFLHQHGLLDEADESEQEQ